MIFIPAFASNVIPIGGPGKEWLEVKSKLFLDVQALGKLG